MASMLVPVFSRRAVASHGLLKTHAHIQINGLRHNIVFGTKLITLYAKFDALGDVRKVFNKMSERNVFLWNALIRGYSGKGFWQQTLELYFEMRAAGTQPNFLTFPIVIRACAVLSDLQKSKEIHCHVGRGRFESNIYVENALIDMYAKCGNVSDARQVFDKMPRRDVISWTAMIRGYSQNGLSNDAMFLFNLMQRSDVQPNAVTLVNALPACVDLGFVEQGQHLHNHIIESGFGFDVSVGTALIDIYAKCGSIEKARHLFDKMHERNIIMWTAMITGYIRNGYGEMALDLFHQMLMTNLKPDSITTVNVLSACISLGNLNQGKWIHTNIIRSRFDSEISVVTALIDMYTKCGALYFACKLFDKMVEKDVVSWNTVIGAYGMHGYAKEALELFSKMRSMCAKPDHITYICVLSTCSHAGLVDEGWQYYKCMLQDYCIMSSMEHYVCMVDLLGRAGQLEEAHVFIQNMSLEPNP